MVGRSTSCQRLIFLTMAPRYCQSVKLPFQSYFTCAVHELMHPNKPENSKCREAVFISDFRFSACLPGLMVLRRRMWTAEQKANIAPPTVFHRLGGGVYHRTCKAQTAAQELSAAAEATAKEVACRAQTKLCQMVMPAE